jgi:hypothetical protein
MYNEGLLYYIKCTFSLKDINKHKHKSYEDEHQ